MSSQSSTSIHKERFGGRSNLRNPPEHLHNLEVMDLENTLLLSPLRGYGSWTNSWLVLVKIKMHRGVYTCVSTVGKVLGKGFDPARAMSLLRQASIVVLDVDSTIIRKEGIDMLASFLHKEDDILSLKKG